MTTKYPAPEVAEMYGRLQAQTNRAVLAEAKLKRANEALESSIKWSFELVKALIDARLEVPPKHGHGPTEPLTITSGKGTLALSVPNTVVVFEDGAAAERVLMKLIEQAREAFPETFVEVF